MPSPSLPDYLNVQWPYIRPLFGEQVELVLLTMAIAALVGVAIGALSGTGRGLQGRAGAGRRRS